jgi:serine/threonine protein kinase
LIDNLDDWPQQERWARRAGYEIVEVLGRDREGFTYKARQVALDRVVVLRRITALNRFVPAAKSRFRWEAHLLARLHHPSIVEVYDQGEQNDLSYFAREFVEGSTLMPSPFPLFPEDKGEWNARRAADIVETLARAIQAAHAVGTVHGGLHPGSVHVTPAGVPKITSFRRARLPAGRDTLEPLAEDESRRRACYLAPEQLEGKYRSFSTATDVYALGAILYTLLTGQPPFLSPTLQETLEQVRAQTPMPPSRRQATIPRALEAICMKCLEKQPGRRPASALALADELHLFLAR